MLDVCVGRRELGKTTLALYLTRNKRPRVTFDPRALCPAPSGRATTSASVNEWFNALHNSVERNDGAHQRADLTVTPDTDTQVVFEYVCGELKTWLQTGRQAAFIVDESTFMDLEHTDAFQWIIRQAPRHQAFVVLTQHRPYDIPIGIRSIIDRWCVFRTIEPRDLKVIAERCTDAFAAEVSKLRPHQFMVWDDSRADSNVTIYTDPKVWFIPLAESAGVPADTSRGELPPGNSPLRKPLALFPEGE